MAKEGKNRQHDWWVITPMDRATTKMVVHVSMIWVAIFFSTTWPEVMFLPSIPSIVIEVIDRVERF